MVKEIIDKMEFVKSKNTRSSKGITKKINRQATDGKKIFARYITKKVISVQDIKRNL